MLYGIDIEPSKCDTFAGDSAAATNGQERGFDFVFAGHHDISKTYESLCKEDGRRCMRSASKLLMLNGRFERKCLPTLY